MLHHHMISLGPPRINETPTLSTLQVWTHPFSELPLPKCAKALVLDDLGRKTTMQAHSRADVAKAAHCLVHSHSPSAASIKLELETLSQLLAQRLFTDMPPGKAAEWEKAQLQYLKRVRRRPGGLRGQTPQAARPIQRTPAGGPKFSAAVKIQMEDVTVNGLLAAHEIKKWVVCHNFQMTLGTAGTERHWRNWQRMARNLARSHGEAKSVYLIGLQRWLREIQARSASCRRDPSSWATTRTRVAQLAAALVHGPCPLNLSPPQDPVSIYALYLQGKL